MRRMGYDLPCNHSHCNGDRGDIAGSLADDLGSNSGETSPLLQGNATLAARTRQRRWSAGPNAAPATLLFLCDRTTLTSSVFLWPHGVHRAFDFGGQHLEVLG